MQSKEITNKLAKLIAFRIVDDREMVVDFLRSRTDYEIPEDYSNEYLASVLTDMAFDEKKKEKLAKLITKDVEFLNDFGVSAIILITIAVIGTGTAIASDVKQTETARVSAISGLTLEQVEYDRQMVENRAEMSQDFFAAILKNEKEIQEQKRQVISEERKKNLIYLVIFISILTASFAIVLKK